MKITIDTNKCADRRAIRILLGQIREMLVSESKDQPFEIHVVTCEGNADVSGMTRSLHPFSHKLEWTGWSWKRA